MRRHMVFSIMTFGLLKPCSLGRVSMTAPAFKASFFFYFRFTNKVFDTLSLFLSLLYLIYSLAFLAFFQRDGRSS